MDQLTSTQTTNQPVQNVDFSSEADRSSILMNMDSSNSNQNGCSNNSLDSCSSDSGSVISLPSSNNNQDEEMDYIIVEEKLNSSVTSSNNSVSTSNLSKKNKVKRSKEEIEKEKQERQAKKDKEAEEKRLRREEREKKLKISRQQKEEKRREIEENKRLREQKRIEKEKELEEKKRIADEQKRISDEKKAKLEAEKEQLKRERDEKKRAEEEEKNKRKQVEEEKNRKQQLVASKFKSFFHKVSPDQKKKPKIGNLELQKDQSIANYIPEISKEKFVLGAFDSQVIHQDTQLLYLDEIKNKIIIPHKDRRQQTNQTNDDVIVDGSQIERKVYRAKLLQFHENLRPPYYGTWRKKSKLINGKNPFSKDMNWFDYDVESDLEWEEEEEGEIIKDSDSEKDKLEDEDLDDGDDYELDEFFVPHGHLSDDENQDDEHCELIETPDGQKKRKLLTKEKILVEERTKKLKRLIPKAIGCLRVDTKDAFENNAKFKQFEKYRVVFVN